MTPERLNRSGTEFTEQKMLRLDRLPTGLIEFLHRVSVSNCLCANLQAVYLIFKHSLVADLEVFDLFVIEF